MVDDELQQVCYQSLVYLSMKVFDTDLYQLQLLLLLPQ
jgi:hypothetical protein